MASVLVPVLYIIIVFGGLGVFSFIYRRKAASKSLPPYFPPHAERNAYVTLLQKSDPPASDPLLKSALVRRAMADVQRVLRLREDKPALQALLQKGSIGDDLWNSLLAAEKELEAEIVEVVSEANTFVEGWGQVIFPTANEMIANEKMRSLFESSEETKQALELKYGIKTSTSAGSALPVLTVGPPPIAPAAPSTPQAPAKSSNGNGNASSDGESVASPASASRTPNKSSAKKGKKRK
ncbi:Pre protein translocase subunit Sec66-domain-containing protein [Mycena maculata]|uniref:Pre protein translocase subunit Sec66-domain-containing protein n=1 Tax=Mycena maculata TaxID=230809 RepID=A0AAD7IFB6_9AGAR|nr:Pre protein translocase subunit Sec66-domain-containing protein [Mycena maculata]